MAKKPRNISLIAEEGKSVRAIPGESREEWGGYVKKAENFNKCFFGSPGPGAGAGKQKGEWMVVSSFKFCNKVKRQRDWEVFTEFGS